MSEPIKVGDLVQIVKPSPCCGSYKNVGKIYTVAAVNATPPYTHCAGCFKPRQPNGYLRLSSDSPDNGHIEQWRVRKIPPLSELEGEKRDEEITA